MIFVTVGTQVAFPRLLTEVDRWAALNAVDVIAQVGCDRNSYKNLSTVPMLSEGEMDRLFSECQLVVGHAGMGTIINALVRGKHVVIVPRQSSLGEQRNDHQFATAKMFEERKGVHVVWEECLLGRTLSALLHSQEEISGMGADAPDQFVNALRRLIEL